MAASTGLPFTTVAAAFEELERTSSRKQLTTILADLLRQVDAGAIAEVAYLLQGRAAPLYQPIEFGLGERSIEKAVGEIFGVAPEEVRRHYARAGDLALVVAELATAAGHADPGTDLTVRDVFDDSRRIADSSGPCSAERPLRA